MGSPIEGCVIERASLRDSERVFIDRAHAGAVLAEMLAEFRGSEALLLAIPAGGVPVAAVVARTLELPIDVAVVSKITLPWTTEAGYGAVAFDGSVRLNRGLAARVRLSEAQIEEGVARTRSKVERRVERLRGQRDWPSLAARPVVLIDDGLASGFTMLVAVEAVRAQGAERVLVAVPTAPADTVHRGAQRVDALYVANVRSSLPFAVADAYQSWHDVSEDEVVEILEELRGEL